MYDDKNSIETCRQETLESLDAELASLPAGAKNPALSYYEWYGRAENIRRIFYEIIYKFQPAFTNPYRLAGHFLDHHLYGYISPLVNYRTGFDKRVLDAWQQLSLFSKFFTDKGIRFIYAALPCKVAVYPGIMLPKAVFESVPNIIPQWRYFIRQLLENGIETVDLFPPLLHEKEKLQATGTEPFPYPAVASEPREACGLYGFYHYISPVGCDTVAEYLASYLAATTRGIPSASCLRSEPYTLKECNSLYKSSRIIRRASSAQQQPYDGRNSVSEIGIFGNCNLQRYLGTGVDITSKISWHLNYPLQYCGRILPFDRNWEKELENIPDGVFHNKKIVIYLGFPSASFVRSPGTINRWAISRLPQRLFEPGH